jgi:hypothetical protein
MPKSREHAAVDVDPAPSASQVKTRSLKPRSREISRRVPVEADGLHRREEPIGTMWIGSPAETIRSSP